MYCFLSIFNRQRNLDSFLPVRKYEININVCTRMIWHVLTKTLLFQTIQNIFVKYGGRCDLIVPDCDFSCKFWWYCELWYHIPKKKIKKDTLDTCTIPRLRRKKTLKWLISSEQWQKLPATFWRSTRSPSITGDLNYSTNVQLFTSF